MDERRRRTDLACAAMLCSPIFVIGSLALMNTSRDSQTTANIVWSWILLTFAVAMFAVGSAVWFRNRNHDAQESK